MDHYSKSLHLSGEPAVTTEARKAERDRGEGGRWSGKKELYLEKGAVGHRYYEGEKRERVWGLGKYNTEGQEKRVTNSTRDI